MGFGGAPENPDPGGMDPEDGAGAPAAAPHFPQNRPSIDEPQFAQKGM
jgi:hypothetical protein